MKRIGYIGLSTPIYYDYGFNATSTEADSSSSPNPILEGAFGALLLYDELWFLTKSLCPENMRHLSYIKFLDEMSEYEILDRDWLPSTEETFQKQAIADFSASFKYYEVVKNGAGIYWDARADNHTHSLRVRDKLLNGNSWDTRNVIYDILTVENLPINVELVTNSFSSRLLKSESDVNHQLNLTEILILDSVPQFISPEGPYHECLEEVKDSKFLTTFRKWITEDSLTSSGAEVSEIKKEVDSKLKEAQDAVFLKYLDPKGSYSSLGETLLGVGTDLLLPSSSTVKGLVTQFNDEKKKNGSRWQGFIVEARNKIKRA